MTITSFREGLWYYTYSHTATEFVFEQTSYASLCGPPCQVCGVRGCTSCMEMPLLSFFALGYGIMNS
jgi:hypothetical protein